MTRPDSKRLEAWATAFRGLQHEIEDFVGETPSGFYDNPLATLARFAAERAEREMSDRVEYERGLLP